MGGNARFAPPPEDALGIHSSSNSNPAVEKKLKSFYHQVMNYRAYNRMGMLTKACKLFWPRFRPTLQVLFLRNKNHEAL